MKNLFGRINFQSKLNTYLFAVAVVMVIPFISMGLLLQAFVAMGLLVLLFAAFFIDPIKPNGKEGKKAGKRATAFFEIITQGSVLLSIAVTVGVFNTLSAYEGVTVYAVATALIAGLTTMFVAATAPTKV